MLIIEANQRCPHASHCPYNTTESCHGARPQRNSVFECTYITNGVFSEIGKERNSLDQTGNMKIIME